MHELKEKLKPLCKMKKCLSEWAECEIDKGKESVCTQEMGEVIDMIKDLAEAEEKLIKGCYYKKIIEAMDEQEEEDELLEKMFANPMICEFLSEKAPEMMEEYEMFNQRMGYPRGGRGRSRGQRRSQSGRFMSTSDGRGRRMGYDGNDFDENQIRMIVDEYMMKTGNIPERGMGDMRNRPFDHYKEARRHYTETRSPKDKEEMDSAAHQHIADTMASMREIWKYADPDMKKRVKQDFTTLMNEMTM